MANKTVNRAVRRLVRLSRRLFYRTVHAVLPTGLRQAARRAVRGPYPEESEAARSERERVDAEKRRLAELTDDSAD